MIEIIIKDFNIEKAQKQLHIYMKKRNLLETLFLRDLINYQKNMPCSILYRELLIKKHYSKELVSSVLNDLGYELTEFIDSSKFKKDTDKKKSKFHLIVFGPAKY